VAFESISGVNISVSVEFGKEIKAHKIVPKTQMALCLAAEFEKLKQQEPKPSEFYLASSKEHERLRTEAPAIKANVEYMKHWRWLKAG